MEIHAGLEVEPLLIAHQQYRWQCCGLDSFVVCLQDYLKRNVGRIAWQYGKPLILIYGTWADFAICAN